MNPEYWNKITEILEVALDKEASLDDYLDKVCQNDQALRAEIVSLIQMRKQAEGFLEVRAIDMVEATLTKNSKNNNNDTDDITYKTESDLTDANKEMTGRILGDFLVKEKLGEGGFGSVHKAIQITLKREAVVKILHTKHRTNPQVIERFKREAYLASRLEHPYCAHIYSFGAESDGLLWIAMEMVTGTPLNELLKEQSSLPLERTVLLVDKICEVLHAAHESGIVHRDIKPANIMIVSRAGRLFPKLLDFGIAKDLSQESSFLNNPSTDDFNPLSMLQKLSLGVAVNQETIIEGENNKGQETIIDNVDNEKDSITNNQNNLKTDENVNNQETVEDNIAKDTNKHKFISKTSSNKIISQEINSSNINVGVDKNLEARKEKIDSEPINSSNSNKSNLSTPYQLRTLGVIGSPAYMSPEQWNKEKVDARSDLYSLGVLTYKMITGEHPFKETGYDLYNAHISKAIPPLKPGFPALLNDVMQKVLAKKPEDRYQSALEFAKEFRYAAGFTQEQLDLPELDIVLKDTILGNAPKPIADTVSSLIAARNTYQFRDRTLLVFHTLVHYLGILALTSYVSTSKNKQNNELINKILTTLHSQALSEIEWIDLARKLCRPFTKKRDTHPIPELVNLFFAENSEFLSPTNEIFAKLLNLQEKIRSHVSLKEDELIKLLRDFLSKLTILLEETSWLNSYYLVLPQGQKATKWMGIAKDHNLVTLKSSNVADGKTTLIDSDGYFVLSLWPLIEITPPTPSAANEVFLLESKGRHGAKLISFPQGFEIESESPWQWLKEHFFADDQKAETDYLVETSPYLGLAAFSASDSSIFFGREKETECFLNRLRIQPLLAVVGPSGAGKSSFIQAGLIASLGHNWQVITLRPGISPLDTLSAKFSRLGIEIPNLKETLQKDITILGKYLRQFAIKQNKTLLIAIDQFEEILTLCLDKQEQRLYVEAIVSAARSEEDPIRVVLTMRDDFLVRAKELKGLKEYLSQSLEILTTPSSEQLLNILILPARRASYEFEDKELPLEIVEELTGQSSALPLLAFTAEKLWQQRDKQFKQLRRRSYQAMGGVAGALAKHAEEMLEKMTQSEQALVRETFRHLVTSEGTRAILTRQELLQLLGKTADSETTVEKLISARLLISSEGEKGLDRIEIIHETLLQSWPRLVKWRQEDQEGARLRDQLRAAARQWHERNRPKGLLWRDEALTELKLWHSRYPGKLTDIETSFVNMTFAEATRSQQRKRFLYVTAFTILLVALVGTFWLNREMHNQLLESYLDKGRNELSNGHPMQAAVYFSEVYKQGKDSSGLRILLGQAMQSVDIKESVSFNGHSSGVNQACFSPDYKRVVTASDDYTARIWNVATSKTEFVLSGHSDEVLGVDFSHNAKLIATASRDKSAKIWDASNGKLIQTIDNPSGIVRRVSFSLDDTQLLIMSENKEVKLLDLASGKYVLVLKNSKEKFHSATFSPDGTKLLTGDDTTAKLWDGKTGDLLFSMEGHMGAINSSAFSPDKTKIATASNDNTAKIWDATNGKLVATLEGHKSYLSSIAFSRDGKLIATASDKIVKIWNAINYQLISSLELHSSSIWAVSFNSDATQLLTASFDGNAKIWDISTVKINDETLVTYSGGTCLAEYSKNGEFIVTSGGGNQVKIFDAKDKKLIRSIKVSDTLFKVIRISISPDGKQIVTASFFGFDSVSTNAAGKSLDKTAKVWDRETGKLLFTLVGHEADVTAVKFSPDATKIATVSYDKTAKIWDAKTGKLQHTLIGHNGGVTSVDFRFDSSQIVTSSNDEGSVKIWDVNTGKLLRSLDGYFVIVVSAGFSYDGSSVVVVGNDGAYKVIDIKTGKILFSFSNIAGELNYNNDGSLIVTALPDSTAKIWDAKTGKFIISLKGHFNWVTSASFSSDSRQLVTGGDDGVAKIWNIPWENRTPEEIAKIIEERVPFRFEDGHLIPVLHKATLK